MKTRFTGRRNFLRNAAAVTAGMIALPAAATPVIMSSKQARPRIKFSVIGINHNHINSLVNTITEAGGEFVSFYARENDLSLAFSKKFPAAKRSGSIDEILQDTTIQLVVSAAIPDERAPLGIRVMQHGKDFLADKPGILTSQQLKEVRKVQKETGRIYAILYGERLENKATLRAGELVKNGAIGKVIQTIGLGPHRLNISSRPEWFFTNKHYGGILVDIASHQCEQFLYFTGSKTASVVTSQVANYNHPQHREMQDFGDALVKGDGGTGYMRVDWFSPDGLDTWGDARLTILGTEGYMEIRKNIDLAGRKGGDHLFVVDKKGTRYVESNDVELTYGKLLVDDILNRTETAMTQEHCFLAAELAILAQEKAVNITAAK